MRIILSIVLCLFAFNTFADCKVKVRVVKNYRPEYYQDEKGNWAGMAVELAQVLVNEAKCEPIYVNLPWKRALKSMQDGKVDLLLNLSITDERKEYMYFIGPQRDETSILVVKKDSDFKINSLEDLKKLPRDVALVRGTFYGKAFDDKFKNDPIFAKKMHFTNNTKQLVGMLDKGRVSAFIDDRYPIVYRIKTDESYKGFKIHPFHVNQDWVYFGLSKKSVSKELLVRLQTAYDQAKSKGKFEEVLDNYR